LEKPGHKPKPDMLTQKKKSGENATAKDPQISKTISAGFIFPLSAPKTKVNFVCCGFRRKF